MVDATFLNRSYRGKFREIAHDLGVPLWIMSLNAPHEVLARRIENRRSMGKDASEADLAVLAHQIESEDPLDNGELERTVMVDTDTTWTKENSAALLAELLDGTGLEN